MTTLHSLSNVAQERVPILEHLLTYSNQNLQPLHVPGHKEGRFFPENLRRILGEQTLAIDLPTIDEAGLFSMTEGCIAEAQALAAQLYGSAYTRYLTHGSTSGVIAMVMAALNPGESILLARNAHRSVYTGLVLSRAHPIYLMPKSNPHCGALPILPEDIRAAFRLHPEIKAVLLTRPTYYGIAQDLEEIIQICHENHCPLLIDEAHGAHLTFLPPGHIQQALDFGADIVVQGAHKTLCSLHGSAQIHLGHQSLISVERFQIALNLLQSTSPSFLLLASLDATRQMMWQEGPELFAQAVAQAERLRQQINELPGIMTLDIARHPDFSKYQFDPLRLVINLKQTTITGFEAREILLKQFKIECEMEDFYNLVFILGPFIDEQTCKNLVNALRLIAKKAKTTERTLGESTIHHTWPMPALALDPCDAILGKKSLIKLDDAENRICGEVVTPFPPGIPIICPGEIISSGIIEFLQVFRENEVYVQATDSKLHSISVLD